MNFVMDHIVINVVDSEKMLHFYSDVLQLPGERVEMFRERKVPFPSVRLNNDTVIDLFPQKMWEKTNPEQFGRPNLNHFCMTTDKASWVLLRIRLAEHGVTIDEGPVERWGAHGTGISIYFRDPEGNVIEARYYEDAAADRSCLLGS